MSCNCHVNTTSVCSRCANGLSCGCPPDYSVAPILPDCQCCPEGYVKTYIASTGTYVCEGNGRAISTIPCQPCETSVLTDCVFYKDATGGEAPLCVDIADGDNLTTILAKMCITRPSNILAMLTVLANDVTLRNALCEIVSICPTIGAQTPIPGPIIFTFP